MRTYKPKHKRPPTLPPDERLDLYEFQGRACGVCREPAELDDLEIEHSHRTGRCRSLAHHACNVELGALGDSPKQVRERIRHYRGLLAYLANPPAKRMKGEAG